MMTERFRYTASLLSLLAATSPHAIAASFVRQRPWASALFVGVRLTIAIRGENDAGLDQWLATLPEVELPLPRHFVADAEVVERSANAATIELLLIEG